MGPIPVEDDLPGIAFPDNVPIGRERSVAGGGEHDPAGVDRSPAGAGQEYSGRVNRIASALAAEVRNEEFHKKPGLFSHSHRRAEEVSGAKYLEDVRGQRRIDAVPRAQLAGKRREEDEEERLRRVCAPEGKSRRQRS